MVTNISDVKTAPGGEAGEYLGLLSVSGNPVPPGGTVERVATADGVALRTAFWPSGTGPARGTVLILQGRAEFIEKYFEVVGELRARGFDVVAFDWRGQGGSDRALPDRYKGHVHGFADFRADFEAVASRFLGPQLDRPLYVMAHSMGGCVALIGAHEGWLGADRLIVSGPMIGLSLVKVPGVTRLLVRMLVRLGLSSRFVPGGYARSISTLPFEGNRLSLDRGRYERNAAVARALDWGAIGSPTIGWLRAAYEAMDRLADAAVPGSIATPTLIVASDADPICSSPAIALFARGLKAGTLVTVPGARHEVLMESDEMRALFWTAFDAFVADSATRSPSAELAASA